MWGTQIISVRNLIRFLGGSLGCIAKGDFEVDKEKPICTRDWGARIIMLAMAHTHALRAQLRPFCKFDASITALHDRDRFLTEEERESICRSRNPANAILELAGTIVGAEYKNSSIDSHVMVQLSQLLDRLCAIQTGCERIHNTSMPVAYSLLVHRTAFLYVILAPFAMVQVMGWWTPVFTAVIAYTFFGLDELARQLQEPFRDEPHCLALSAMCRTIEIDVSEALGMEVPHYMKARPGSKLLM